jgi:2-methylcitrate dehydratase PrpD
MSADMLAQLERTLTKPYYCSRRSPAPIEAAVRLIVSEATIVVPTISISGVTTHPEGDLVHAVAASARVDHLARRPCDFSPPVP